MPANAAERKMLHRMLLLGLGLTACAVAFELTGLLGPLEGFFFDQRVRHYQFNTPAPTDKIVHLDVDENSIEDMGRWPWPRSVFADIARELQRAGAKVVAWDVVFSDRFEEPSDPQDDSIHPEDQAFSVALAQSGRNILPLNFNFNRPPGTRDHYFAIKNEVDGNLELTLDDVNRKLAAKHAAPATEDEFRQIMRDIAFEQLTNLFKDGAKSFQRIQEALLPNLTNRMVVGAPQIKQLRKEYNKFLAWRAARRLFPYVPENHPPLLEPTNEALPLPAFGNAILASGWVSEGIGADATIRSLPLYVDFQGQLVPQFGYAVALAYLGVKPEDVRLESHAIIVPGAGRGGGDLVIPTSEQFIQGFGDRGTFVDVPLFGTSDWRTMYDYPGHQKIVQHYPMNSITGLRSLRRSIRHNNEVVDKAFHEIFLAGDEHLKTFESHKHDMDAPDAMLADIAAIEDVRKSIIDAYKGMSTAEFAKLELKEKEILKAAEVLPGILEQNTAFIPMIKEQEAILHDRVGGKAVIIGATGEATDLRTTSLHKRVPGVVIHDAIFNGVLTGYFWRRLPEWATILATIFIGAAATLTASYLRPIGALLWTLLIGVGFAAVSACVLFGRYRLINGMAAPLTAVFFVWAVIPFVRYFTESAMRARIQRRFSTYVDPSLVNFLIEHPEKMRLEGELKEITVVFTDLQGFTALTEKMRERAVEILSQYMALVVPLIRSHRGFVSKFIGDGVMFFYGAPLENPHQASDAVDTAMDMLCAVDGFADSLARRGLDKLGLRIGINTATMVVGDTGIESAADYTPLGDGMNLGSRLEGANKMFGTRVLISARTVYLLDGRYLVRKIANLVVKGKTEAVMAYEPLCLTDQASDVQKQMADTSNAMIDAYIAAEFEQCLQLADKFDAQFGKNKLTACYRERAQNCINSPPTLFNGTIQLSEK